MEILHYFPITNRRKERPLKKSLLVYLPVIASLLIYSLAFAGRVEQLGPKQFADYETVLQGTGKSDLAIESGTIEYPDRSKGPKIIMLNCLNERGDKAVVTIKEFPAPKDGASPMRIIIIKEGP
jgi:hypothetical protein